MKGQAAMVAQAGAVLLVLATAYLFLQNSELAGKVSALEGKVAGLEQGNAALKAANSQLGQSLSSTQGELAQANGRLESASSQVAFLNLTISQKDSEISSLRGELASEKGTRQQLAQEYAALQRDINSSMAWFSENAQYPEGHSWSASILAKRLKEDCVEGGKFKLACASYVLQNVGSAIHYRTDIVSSGKEDHLQSLAETIDSGWGDCEDYSLLLKSIMNMVKRDLPEVRLEAWQDGGSGNYRVYPLESRSDSTENYYYYPDTKGVNLGTAGGSFYYVVCYNVNYASGHCIVAVSDSESVSSQEMPLLSGARLFEPQNGAYMGTVGSELGVCGNGDCGRHPGEIYLVISDYDLYKHDGDSWVGYADYAARAASAQG